MIKQVSLLFALSIAFLLAFQNCSEVSLLKPEVVVVAKSIDKVAGNYCAPSGATFSNPTKIVFMIDMSTSNLGSLNAQQVGRTSANSFRWSYDFSGAADLEGKRFEAIKQFISGCGSANNIEYAVIGFGARAIFTESQSCVSKFVNQQQALQAVDELKDMQESDRKNPSRTAGSQSPFHLERETNYDKAISCLRDKVVEDTTFINDQVPVYHTFFLTDGMNTASEATMSQMLNNISSLKQTALSNGAASIHLHPVFYTSLGANNQGQESESITLLNQMAKLIDNQASTSMLSNFSSFDQEICESLSPEVISNFSLSRVYAVNLTAKMIGANLYADSDMDGVIDAEEEALGLNPTLARTHDLLDGICQGDINKCKTSNSVCEKKGISLGLSDCDVAYLNKNYNIKTNGTDYDGDGLLDYIEIIRGSSMIRADAIDNISGDGISNFNKIAWGMDIHSDIRSKPVPKANQVDLKVELDQEKCLGDKDQYSYEFENAPLVNTLAFTDKLKALFDLSHKENENVYMLISIWSPLGGTNMPSKAFGQKILIHTDGTTTYGEFRLIGELAK